MDRADYSIYIHIPFCKHRCGYCDFNTYAGIESLIPAYVEALCAEIHDVARLGTQQMPVHTVYFGGGTPSLFPLAEIERILENLRGAFNLRPSNEITLEANPGTVSPDYLAGLHSLGVNRLSFGMQSADPFELVFLERQHDLYDTFHAVEWSRKTGVQNISLDLIYGLPGQTLERWQRTLETALGLLPEHLSLYALSIEEGTPLYRWIHHGLVSMPDDDLAAEMYEWASGRLASAGYRQYEISNWASQDRAGEWKVCRHNLQYWRSLPYLGFGAGAHGYAAGVRTANVRGVRAYIARCRQASTHHFPIGPATEEQIELTPWVEMQEFMMVGLRLTQEGVSGVEFLRRFGKSLDEVFPKQIRKLIHAGLLEWHGSASDALRLTQRGRLLGNRVFMEFVGLEDL